MGLENDIKIHLNLSGWERFSQQVCQWITEWSMQLSLAYTWHNDTLEWCFYVNSGIWENGYQWISLQLYNIQMSHSHRILMSAILLGTKPWNNVADFWWNIFNMIKDCNFKQDCNILRLQNWGLLLWLQELIFIHWISLHCVDRDAENHVINHLETPNVLAKFCWQLHWAACWWRILSIFSKLAILRITLIIPQNCK